MSSSDLAMSLLEQRVPLTLLIDLAMGLDVDELALEYRRSELGLLADVSA